VQPDHADGAFEKLSITHGVTVASVGNRGEDGVDWLVLDEPQVAAQIERAPAHPVSYADRVGPLLGEHPALVINAGTAMRVVSQSEATELASALRARYALDNESRTYIAAPMNRQVELFEFLFAGTAGAAMVVPEVDVDDERNVADVIADEWVTHAFVSADQLAQLVDDEFEDLVTVVVVDGEPDRDTVARWASKPAVLASWLAISADEKPRPDGLE
jgi:hypothetical protein